MAPALPPGRGAEHARLGRPAGPLHRLHQDVSGDEEDAGLAGTCRLLDLLGLDPQRALASLSAELTRREKVLAAAGAKDIEDYTERAVREPRHRPLPRLVIVIDEFASLARDLPDFVAGLVGIAQRGRSLGIHLILATQRPSGVVSADIRANINLRADRARPGPVRRHARPHCRRAGPVRPFGRAGRHGPLVPGRRCPGHPDHATPVAVAVLAGHPGVTRSFEQSDLGKAELGAALTALTGPGVLVIDDADLLAGCEAGGELPRSSPAAAGAPWRWSLPAIRTAWPAGSAAGWPTPGEPGEAA